MLLPDGLQLQLLLSLCSAQGLQLQQLQLQQQLQPPAATRGTRRGFFFSNFPTVAT